MFLATVLGFSMRQYPTHPSREVFKIWKELVNMTENELRVFITTPEGRTAGLPKERAKELDIKSGQESARWILRMKPTASSFKRAKDTWTPMMWSWARRQNSFLLRTIPQKHKLYDDKGRMTPYHKALMIWGHDPEKRT